MDGWRGEKKSELMYVMKDGNNLFDYLASSPPTDDSDSDVVSDSVLEDSDTQPQPPSDSEDDHVIYPRITYIGSVQSQHLSPKLRPEW
jgi:hypothetical protein